MKLLNFDTVCLESSHDRAIGLAQKPKIFINKPIRKKGKHEFNFHWNSTIRSVKGVLELPVGSGTTTWKK